MRFTLRQLQVFLATARYQNITKAAHSLSMSQSAASDALKELEQQFDIQLFDRVGKRLQINELGQVMRSQAEALLDHAQDVEQKLAQHQQVGKLRLGATLTIGNHLAVPLVSEFMARFPHAKVTLEVANTQSIAEQLLNFDLDIGLIEGELQNNDLEIKPWKDDELVLFCSPEHELAHKQTMSDDDLCRASWILREAGSGTRQAFDRAMHSLLPKLNTLIELQHTEAIKHAVEANLGLSCLSKISLVEEFKRGSLVPLQAPDKDFKRTLYVVYHRHKFLTEGMLSWLSLCGVRA